MLCSSFRVLVSPKTLITCTNHLIFGFSVAALMIVFFISYKHLIHAANTLDALVHQLRQKPIHFEFSTVHVTKWLGPHRPIVRGLR